MRQDVREAVAAEFAEFKLEFWCTIGAGLFLYLFYRSPGFWIGLILAALLLWLVVRIFIRVKRAISRGLDRIDDGVTAVLRRSADARRPRYSTDYLAWANR